MRSYISAILCLLLLMPIKASSSRNVGPIELYRVATLNTWYIHLHHVLRGLLISKDRSIRMSAIAQYFTNTLSLNHPDAVLMQELWVESDYEQMAAGLRDTYPYSQYFPAGIVGSGQACFSRFPIVSIRYAKTIVYTLFGCV